MSETWYELIGVFRGALDQRRVVTDEAEADRQAREIRDDYRRRGMGWVVYVVPHECELGGDCDCVERLDVYTPRYASNTLSLLREAGLWPT